MNLSSYIAKRYLFAKKSHNVINIISIISAAGIAIGCMALIVILSIYNGFDSIVRSLYSSYTPDLVITPVAGKVFSPFGEKFDLLKKDPSVLSFSEVLEENVFLQYGDKHVIATAKGVDSVYEHTTGLKDHIVEGNFDLQFGGISQVVIGRFLAMELGLKTQFVTPLDVYFPSRTGDVSLLNPISSLKMETLYPAGIVSLDQNFDKKYIFIPLASLRSLLEYENEVSAIEINLVSGVSKNIQKKFSEILGSDYVIKNKYQQNESLYKLLSYEKLAIYLILLFIMIIISCNVFSSLSMLIIEKKFDIEILKSMGATDRLIKKIFVTEGWLISFCGIVVGVVLGLMICVVQQQFGIVKMPGNFIIDAYPVVIKFTDILIIVFGVGIIGYLIARMPLLFFRKNAKK
ncbi:MAG: FtsX-like permease family protein [Bacteroidales bacterium]|jgi:ABC-type lipoprotein release transport system permease subunit